MTAPDAPRGPFRGHRDTPLGRSPFGETVPAVAAAIVFAIATLVWAAFGEGRLPGDRWLAVHLFTLGVLTNVVLVFSQHFGRTLTRVPGAGVRGQTLVVNVGITILLVGLPTEARWAVATGATIVTGVVVASYVRLRRWRRQAVGARFGWIVRVYERAHGAFVHGAILGALLGVGVLSGTWYGAARMAHLHVNVLGWGGLTLLATIVFFGPTMARTRIEPGADARAARALRWGATGLTLGVLLLLLSAIDGPVGLGARIAAAAGLALYAWATTVACLPVARAAHRANPSPTRRPVVAVTLWFPVVAWLDVVVVATGTWRWLDALGLAVLVGVLAQAIVTVLTYLAPMLRSRGFAGRDQLLHRLERGELVRAVAYNFGAVAVVAGAATRSDVGAVLAWGGWSAIALTLVWLLGAALLPLDEADGEDARSQIARRYRQPPAAG